MDRLIFCLSLCAVLFALCFPVDAQQPKKVLRIGYLTALDPATEFDRSEPFRLALRKLGYIEGQNIAIEYRNAEGKLDRYPELAAELVRLKVDIIVTTGGSPTLAAKNATQTIPIVCWAFRPILSRQAWLKALPVPAAISPALRTLDRN